MAVLCVDKGVDRGKQIELASDNMTIVVGRREDVDLQLEDNLVSSRHFQIKRAGYRITIEDLRSTNGLFVNGERVTRTDLKADDIIRAGDTFMILITDEEATDPSAKAIRDLGGCQLLERIGVGGMGVVYRALQTSLDREVAVKILSPKFTKDQETVGRFVAEARAAGRLTHANVVQVHDVGDENGQYYIVMEYVGGGSLIESLNERGVIDPNTATRVALDVAKGLEYAETKKIIHCDIKPENIMLTETGLAKIADLGIARKLEEGQAKDSTVMGSPHYMSPEQAQGLALDHRTDLYALGCTLYRMLTGQTPFSGSDAREIMRKQVYETPVDVQRAAPEVPDDLAAVVRSLMQKRPAERIQTAGLLVSELEDLLTEASVLPPAPAGEGTASLPVRRRAPAMRAGYRVRRQSGPSAGSFIPFAIGAVLLAFGIYAAGYYAMPDAGKEALKRARQYEAAGNLDRALFELRSHGSIDAKVSAEMESMKKRLMVTIRQLKAKRIFDNLWRRYQIMKSDGTDQAQVRAELERLYRAYRMEPDKRALIEEERRSIGLR